MKRPFTFLIFNIMYCSVFFGITFPVGMWLVFKNTELFSSDGVFYARKGIDFGVICGIIIWFIYRFNLHQRK